MDIFSKLDTILASKIYRIKMNEILEFYSKSDYWITFTKDKNLKIYPTVNPEFKMMTPHGLYGYPLKLYRRKILKTEDPIRVFPYAYEYPYCVIYKLKTNAVVINTARYENYDIDMSKISDFFNLKSVDALEEEFENFLLEKHKIPKGSVEKNFSRLYEIIRYVLLREGIEISKARKMMQNIFVKLGNDGIIDIEKEGKRTLSPDIDYQGVFFNKKILEVDGVFHNTESERLQGY